MESSQDTNHSSQVCVEEPELFQPFDIEAVKKESSNLVPIKTGSHVIHLGSLVMIQDTEEANDQIDDLQKWPSALSLKNDAFENYQGAMEREGLEFELQVNSVLRATEFKPFQKKLCCPIRCGKTLKTNPQMRGFWFATVSFFLAFLGWFSMAPLMVVIREDIGLCDNQSEVDAGTNDCICKDSCKNTIGNLKIASLCSTVIMRLLLGGLLEKFGPRKVQCTLLFCGALFVAVASLMQTVAHMIVIGILIGTIGAAFVTNQFWMALMFTPEILGLVNGTAGGWGNLGGGVANMVMPQFYQLTQNWRTAFLFPAGILLLCAILMFWYSQDTPMGPIVVERDLKKKKTAPIDYLKCISDYRVCILATQYGASFGAELIMNWELATHFHDYFGMSVTSAGWLSSGFGAMNLFARSLGGSLSDKMNIRMGLRGRLLVQFLLLFCEGICLLTFGFMSREMKWERAFIVMVCFSIFTQGAEGSTFSIVPYVLPENIGIVSAITGAGGNLFAALIQAAFYKNVSDYLLPFKLHAIFVIFGAFLTFLISFDIQGSLLFKPLLSRYCKENIFTYVLQWELQFDSKYRVIGSYVSPRYLKLLSKKGKQEHYVNAMKLLSVQYGDGLLGAIGETRISCIVHKISDKLVGKARLGADADEIKTVLFFPSADGKRVIEVGGATQYELVDGVSLSDLQLILSAKDNGKDLEVCLREVVCSPVN